MASRFSLLMAITTLLAALVAIQWGYPPALVITVNGFFFVIDCIFFAANSTKLIEGGWFPLLLAGIVAFLMLTWRSGVKAGRTGARRPAPAGRRSDRDRDHQMPCAAVRNRGVSGLGS